MPSRATPDGSGRGGGGPSPRFAARRGLLALAVAIGWGMSPVVAAERARITILHVNDSHSQLTPFGPRQDPLQAPPYGGAARLASLVDRLRRENPGALLLHAGDFLTGTFFSQRYAGMPELRVLRRLRVDALTLGNHEFDRDAGGLNLSLDRAWGAGRQAFPLLAANLSYDAGFREARKLGQRVRPSVLVKRNGLRIGILGLTTPDIPRLALDGVAVLADTVSVASRHMPRLRRQGAEAIVLLSHLGLARDTAIARRVEGIDVIVGGHDHVALAQPQDVCRPGGGCTLIVQAGSHYRYLGKLDLLLERQPDGRFAIVERTYRLLPVDGDVPPQRSMARLIGRFVAGVEARYGAVFRQVLGQARFDIDNQRDQRWPMARDTPLGNLVADAFREALGTDAAIMVRGLIAQPLFAGPMVPADVLRVLPYGAPPVTQPGVHGDSLVRLRVSGRTLLDILETGTRIELAIPGELTGLPLGVAGPDYAPQVSGIRYAYDPAPLEDVRRTHLLPDSLQVGGQPLEPDRYYSVATPRLIGTALLAARVIAPGAVALTPVSGFGALHDFLQRQGEVSARVEGRIIARTVGQGIQ